ncbi:nucleoside-diphosphate-sugar epimerase [Leeuwenhoekiella aestuarii]|uniref:Nucleoside-diphosphate-sugar epimerase n=1 Tax=Leeuwenhoekiella aestuarii TaxID=2249426 RepID=A0A4Q0NZU8_9FLAO|nr:NAD-dependent epimerase/dehydratase family protein [Leeuwenhoekiella aestuarii]RXG18231.1 nucleoside-diphosphate-sugar epimerase [Leeuwenhoekiella aestuarii]RXG19536.1 nucleoside-diphosphate-sugar epimerase [Leeuwenhoekiella aestuarii]
MRKPPRQESKNITNFAAMILVTGGTGLVGSHLLWELLAQGERNIRAIYRTQEKIDPVKSLFKWKNEQSESAADFSKIEWIQGDVTDIAALTEAFSGITYVYHCAALVSFNPKRFDTLQKINVEGTANVVNLCLNHKIEKLCYVSSVAALGDSQKAVTEETHWEAKKENSVYSISKFASEMEVWRGTQEDLDAVIVNPGVILGEGFYKGGSGALFTRVHKGLKYSVPGSTGFVDVEDVVRAMILLMQASVKNKRFILVGHNLKFKIILDQIAKALGVALPNMELKKWQLDLAWKLDWFASLFGKRRKLTKSTARSAYTESVYDNSKLKKELGFEYRDIESTISRVAKHLTAHGS